jgi:biotin/methionine sulfoxide reductase
MRTHSQGGWTEAEAPDGEPFATMRPEDAAARGIVEGGWLRLRSRGGSLVLRARLTMDMARGVVSVYEGTWARLPKGAGGTADGVAAPGEELGSPNALTDTEGSPGSLACVMHALAVEAERA